MHKRFGPHKWAIFIKQVMDYEGKYRKIDFFSVIFTNDEWTNAGSPPTIHLPVRVEEWGHILVSPH